jgi:hypothetical protein
VYDLNHPSLLVADGAAVKSELLSRDEHMFVTPSFDTLTTHAGRIEVIIILVSVYFAESAMTGIDVLGVIEHHLLIAIIGETKKPWERIIQTSL